MPLPITLTMAGAATLINLWLSIRVVQRRMGAKIMMGDGGDALMQARTRAHANFAEYTPFFLILIGLIEYAQGPRLWMWVVGAIYLVARLLHPFGMERTAPNPFRMLGIAGTVFPLLGLAIYALTLAYR